MAEDSFPPGTIMTFRQDKPPKGWRLVGHIGKDGRVIIAEREERVMAVYELAPEERLVAMMEFCGCVIIATTHRLFEMKSISRKGEHDCFEIKPILMEKAAPEEKPEARVAYETGVQDGFRLALPEGAADDQC